MYKITSALLAGSGVSEASHPVLVSLLELAAQRPGISPASFPDRPSWHAYCLRVTNHWKRVRVAFEAARLAGVTDEMLIAACPHQGLSFSHERGWEIEDFQPDTYRLRVVSLLGKATPGSAGAAVASEETRTALMRACARCIVADGDLSKALAMAGHKDQSNRIWNYVQGLRKLRSKLRNHKAI